MRLGDLHVSYHINSIMVTYSTMNHSTNSYKFRLVYKYMDRAKGSTDILNMAFI